MEGFVTLIIIAVVLFIVYRGYRKSLITKRENLINTYRFPNTITEKIVKTYPHLTQQQANLVIKGLREYFHLCNIAGKKMVSMPSQVVDVAWHEFILFTRQYQSFCSKALGRFLHHTPAEAMTSRTRAQQGIKRAWKISCHREKITPKAPERLPILFALDAQLNIQDGFRYSPNCKTPGNSDYCAGHIGCSSGGGGGCVGDSDGGGSGCGGGCGGGD